MGGVRVTHEAAVLDLVLTGDDHPLAGLQIAAEDPGPTGIGAPRFQSALMGVVWNYAISGLFVWRKR